MVLILAGIRFISLTVFLSSGKVAQSFNYFIFFFFIWSSLDPYKFSNQPFNIFKMLFLSLSLCFSFSIWAVLSPSVSSLDIAVVWLRGNNYYKFLEITAYLQYWQQHIHSWVNSVIAFCHWPYKLWNLCLCPVPTFSGPPPWNERDPDNSLGNIYSPFYTCLQKCS